MCVCERRGGRGGEGDRVVLYTVFFFCFGSSATVRIKVWVIVREGIKDEGVAISV